MSSLAVITGASSGIGAEFARRLAESHTHLWLVGRRAAQLSELAAELETQDISVRTLVMDLSESQNIEALADQIRQQPDLKTLINNAGYAMDGLFASMKWDSHERLQRVHVDCTLKLSYAALNVMSENNSGQIVNVSSTAAFLPTPASPLYGPTKAYLRVLSESLALAYADQGIRIQALCPGFTRTFFHERMGINTGKFYRTHGLLRALTPQQVVDRSLNDLRQGRILSIPGWNYRVLVFLLRHLPIKWLYRIASSGRRSARYQSRA